MNLADIVGGQVVIHPDMLAVPPFKKLWDSFKDKDLATKYLWYIVLKNKYDSPYVETMERDLIEPTLKKELLPIATVITPNIPEAEALTGLQITNADSMEEAAHKLYESFHISVLLKGGHRINDANDLLYTNGHGIWLHGERINNPNTHGTGCTLSSAIASNLARGFSLEDSVRRSKQYLTDALKTQLDLGHGSGPLDHTLGKTQ